MGRGESDDDFKTPTVRLALDEGKNIGAVARDLDSSERMLREWVTDPRGAMQEDSVARSRNLHSPSRPSRHVSKTMRRPMSHASATIGRKTLDAGCHRCFR